ncbi:hypothetical protein TNCV_2540981 [Trichonephila clavipes]|nr:hypothetical protein TNCV_2540981 [Trichonephila clavipes]
MLSDIWDWNIVLNRISKHLRQSISDMRLPRLRTVDNFPSNVSKRLLGVLWVRSRWLGDGRTLSLAPADVLLRDGPLLKRMI